MSFAPGLMAQSAPVRIGYSMSRTGPWTGGAQVSQEPNYLLWAEQQNAAGGLDVKGVKRQIELISSDDRSDIEAETLAHLEASNTALDAASAANRRRPDSLSISLPAPLLLFPSADVEDALAGREPELGGDVVHLGALSVGERLPWHQTTGGRPKLGRARAAVKRRGLESRPARWQRCCCGHPELIADRCRLSPHAV